MALSRLKPEEALKLGLLKGQPGERGIPGVQGPQGPQGIAGRDGLDGAPGVSITGLQGVRGVDGIDGISGVNGTTGEKGDKGEIGDAPDHEWRGTSLRFQKGPEEWGKFVNLEGRPGPSGGSGAGGGSAIARIRQLLDTNVPNPSNLDVLTYDSTSSTWIAAAAAGGVTDHTLLTNIGVNTHVQIDTHIADATIHFTEASIDHGNLAGLADDDHLQYLLLLGRAGGQTANGGTVSGDSLILRGSASSPDAGIVEIESPVTFSYDTFSNTTPAQQFLMQWGPTVTANGSYVGGALQTEAVFNISTGVFIPAIFSDTNRYNVAATPGFSAITFINELSVVANDGNFDLPSALVMNVGLVHERNTAGTSTTPGTTGISFSPQTRTNAIGAIMTKTDQTAVRCSVTFSTTGFSQVNLGTIRGVHLFNPAVALFQPASGVETATAIIGVDVNNLTFGGNILKAAVRSAHVSTGTNSYFLQNTGTARSSFGSSNIEFNDSFGPVFGNSQDVQMGWSGGTNELFFQFNALVNQYRISNPSSGRFLFDSPLADHEFNFNCNRFSLGAQTGAVGNQIGVFVAPADTVTIGGEYSQFLLTQAGNVTIDANVSAFGWTINAPSFTAGTGTLTTAAALNVGGNPNLATVNRVGVRIISNPSGGSGVNAALWVTAGRSQFDGIVDINNGDALGGGAAATLGTIGGTGPTAAAQAQWVQIEINGVNHWLPAWT